MVIAPPLVGVPRHRSSSHLLSSSSSASGVACREKCLGDDHATRDLAVGEFPLVNGGSALAHGAG
jgi:hypothetical protein